MRRGAPRWARRLAGDAFARSIIFSAALVVGGFIAIALAWRGAARSLVVAEQLSFLVSGGIGGLAMILTGAGIIAIQASRYLNARERRRLDQILSASPRSGGVVTTPAARSRSRA